jgi:hypothetical protein
LRRRQKDCAQRENCDALKLRAEGFQRRLSVTDQADVYGVTQRNVLRIEIDLRPGPIALRVVLELGKGAAHDQYRVASLHRRMRAQRSGDARRLGPWWRCSNQDVQSIWNNPQP